MIPLRRVVRFGMMCAQMKAFFDATGGLWQKGALVSGLDVMAMNTQPDPCSKGS
jgi:multimeric flavodoxin WrbA